MLDDDLNYMDHSISIDKHQNSKTIRFLENSDLFSQLLISIDPKKLNIKTLKNVFEAFTDSFSNLNMKQYLKFPIDKQKRIPVRFEYESKIWNGNINLVDTDIEMKRMIQSIHFKMSNDGFINTSKYNVGNFGNFGNDENNEKDSSNENDENIGNNENNEKDENVDELMNKNQDVFDLFSSFIQFIEGLKIDFNIEDIRALYRQNDHRVEILFKDDTYSKIISIRFEYRRFDYKNSTEPVYTREKVQELLKKVRNNKI